MSNRSRRKLLKSIAAGSGAVIAGKSLPDNWTKPVVDSVMLPAHAGTSLTTTYYCYNGEGFTYSVAVTGDDITFTAVDGGIWNIEPIGAPKLTWTGSGSTAGGSPVVISVSTDLNSNPNCDWNNPLNPRDVTINLNGNGVPVSMVWPTRSGDFPYDLTPSARPCAFPAIAICPAPD